MTQIKNVEERETLEVEPNFKEELEPFLQSIKTETCVRIKPALEPFSRSTKTYTMV